MTHMAIERWLPVGQAPGYEVSDAGSVRNSKGLVLRPGKSVSGYLAFPFTVAPGRTKVLRIHRAVAEAFVPNPENKPTVDHVNGRRDDNRAENLAWATPSENSRKANRTGGRAGRPIVQLTMAGTFGGRGPRERRNGHRPRKHRFVLPGACSPPVGGRLLVGVR